MTHYFEDGPFFYNISLRSKEAKPKKSINLASYRSRKTWEKENKENENDEFIESPPKSEFRVDQNYVCKYCLKYFSRHEACRNHEKTFHENKLKYNFECSICQQKFRTANGLKSHINNKHSDKKSAPYKCKTCNKEYVNKTHLRRHCTVEGHEYPKEEGSSNPSHRCQICFKYVGRLKYHMELYHSDMNLAANIVIL